MIKRSIQHFFWPAFWLLQTLRGSRRKVDINLHHHHHRHMPSRGSFSNYHRYRENHLQYDFQLHRRNLGVSCVQFFVYLGVSAIIIFSTNLFLTYFLNSKSPAIGRRKENLENHFGFNDNNKIVQESQVGRQWANKQLNDAIFPKRKFWIRISDEVFVYSAHLDIRNFTRNPTYTKYFTKNSSGSNHTFSPNVGRVGEEILTDGIQTQGQNFPELKSNDDDYPVSDKLADIVLVRVVGIKAIPPLRDFIKRDILDWFRIKHEMDFSKKYECKLFFTKESDSHLQQKWRDIGAEVDESLEFITTSNVTYTVIEEGVKKFAGTYINCYFDFENQQRLKRRIVTHQVENLQIAVYPKTVEDYPTKLIDVNIVMLGSGQSREKMNVRNIDYYEKTLAVCVRPLFGPFYSLKKLIQFISYYHAMGITQFNFYLMSTSPKVRYFLRNLMTKKNLYRKSNKLFRSGEKRLPRFIVNDWNLPTGNTSELWDYGTLSALNDCLFSNIDQEFVLFVDVDEFIVPQRKSSSSALSENENKPSLWNLIDSYDKFKTYQYRIRNTFFCNEFCEEVGQSMNNKRTITTLAMSANRRKEMLKTQQLKLGEEEEVSFPANFPSPNNFLMKKQNTLIDLPMFRCTLRTKRIWNVSLRSKFIVNPRQVLSVGHHLVTNYVNGKVDFRFSPDYSVQVDSNVAIMNHYRECGSISSKKHPILTRARENDTSILSFQHIVLNISELYYSFVNL